MTQSVEPSDVGSGGRKAAGRVKSPMRGMSQRMRNARDNMARRQEEFTEKWGHEDATQWPNASSVGEDDIPDVPPAETELGEMVSSSSGPLWEEQADDEGLWSDLDGPSEPGGAENSDDEVTAGMFIDEYSSTDQVSQGTTYDRNSTDREVGKFGGD